MIEYIDEKGMEKIKEDAYFFINDRLSDTSKYIDKEADSINAGEFATMLYAADMDWNNYAKTKDVVSSLDGKVNYDQYQGFSSMIEGDKQYETLKKEREDFYNTFYAE